MEHCPQLVKKAPGDTMVYQQMHHPLNVKPCGSMEVLDAGCLPEHGENFYCSDFVLALEHNMGTEMQYDMGTEMQHDMGTEMQYDMGTEMQYEMLLNGRKQVRGTSDYSIDTAFLSPYHIAFLSPCHIAFLSPRHVALPKVALSW